MPDLAYHFHCDDLTALAVRGPDAATFLQGQLSQDVERLAARGALLAGLHNPQGRCLALLRLFHLGGDQILIVLPAGDRADVRALLARFVLRSKVKIEDAGTAWRIYGLSGPDAEAAATTRIHLRAGSGRLAPADRRAARRSRCRRHMPRAAPSGASRTSRPACPKCSSPTTGEFVAQMLNLDALDAIAFDKGCYTGQEIIARAHYRGQVKRRMQLFHTDSPVMLLPGERIALGDGRRAQVVLSEAIDEGGQEFLAVTTLRRHRSRPIEAAAAAGRGSCVAPARHADAAALPAAAARRRSVLHIEDGILQQRLLAVAAGIALEPGDIREVVVQIHAGRDAQRGWIYARPLLHAVHRARIQLQVEHPPQAATQQRYHRVASNTAASWRRCVALRRCSQAAANATKAASTIITGARPRHCSANAPRVYSP